MDEKRHELVIRIGKTVGPDQPVGYKPEEPIDPKLAIELAHYLVGGSLEFDIAVGGWYASGRIAETSADKNPAPYASSGPSDPPKPDVYPGIECLGCKIPVGSKDEEKCKECIREFLANHSFVENVGNSEPRIFEGAHEIQERKARQCPIWKKYHMLKDNSTSPMRDAPPVYSLKILERYADATSRYAVEISKTSTLRGWIKKILSDTHKRGHIGVNSDEPGTFFGKPEVEYRYGNFISDCDEMTPLLDKVVKSADYSGGYSRGDWLFVLED